MMMSKEKVIGGVAAVILMALFFFSAATAAEKVDPYGLALQDFINQSRQAKSTVTTTEGSLYPGNQPSLFEDFKARRVNDIITILVSETTTASNTADATTAKDSSMDIGITSLLGLETKIPSPIDLVAGIKTGTKNSFAGSGATTRKGIISTIMSARVKEVLPNGNLLIEGIRELTVNHENQTLVITGVVRPRDITTNNIIASSSIADLQIRYYGKGVVNDNLKPGILYRILSRVWPF